MYLDKVLHGAAFDAAVAVLDLDGDVSDISVLVHVDGLVDRPELALADGVLHVDRLEGDVVSAVTHSSATFQKVKIPI